MSGISEKDRTKSCESLQIQGLSACADCNLESTCIFRKQEIKRILKAILELQQEVKND